MTDKFCVLPFLHAVYNPYDSEKQQSNISICCRIDQTTNDFSGTLDPINFGEFRTKIQEQFLSNKFPDACFRCVDEEVVGNKSYREGMNEFFESILTKEEILQKKLRFLEIVPGNTCNLACRMCNNTYSSKRDKFDRFLSDNNFSSHVKKSFPDWRKLDLRDLKILKLMGGEPTHLREHLSLLLDLQQKDVLSNIDLQMPTNTTIKMTEEWKTVLQECKSVLLTISIDAVSNLNDYIRQYSIWKNTLDNVEDLISSFEGSNINIVFNTVITCLNVNKSLETQQFLSQKFSNCESHEDITPYPDYLSIRYLPRKIRQKLLSLDSISDNVRKYLETLPDTENTDISKLLEFINLSDKFYGTSFEQVNPEMYNILKDYAKND